MLKWYRKKKKKIQGVKKNLSSSLYRILFEECVKELVKPFPIAAAAANSAGSLLTARTLAYVLFSGEVFHSVLMLLNLYLHMTAKKGRKCQQEPRGVS